MKMCPALKLYVVAIILITNSPFGFVAARIAPYTTKPAKIGNESTALEFILLHNNDIHARFDETSFVRTYCTERDIRRNKCFGGFPRISTVVKQYRNAYLNEDGLPVLYINAGDTYTGTNKNALLQQLKMKLFVESLKTCCNDDCRYTVVLLIQR